LLKVEAAQREADRLLPDEPRHPGLHVGRHRSEIATLDARRDRDHGLQVLARDLGLTADAEAFRQPRRKYAQLEVTPIAARGSIGEVRSSRLE